MTDKKTKVSYKSKEFIKELDTINQTKNITKTEENLNFENEKFLKSKYTHTYSTIELLKKIYPFCFYSWKREIWCKITTFINQLIQLYVPIYEARIIDSIIKEKNYNSLYVNAKNQILFSLFQLIITEVLDLVYNKWINISPFWVNELMLKNISEKDIEFFEIFKTGEIIDRINESNHTLNRNFIFGFINLFEDLFGLIHILYFFSFLPLSLIITS